MRYFTRGWAEGDFTSEEDMRVRDAYEARLTEIAARLPPDMLRLARDVSLHDGLIESATWNPRERRLQMELVCGVSERGYYLVQLTYRGALLGHRRIASLRRAALSRETEVLYNEVDINEDGTLCHRILFEPNEEVTIDFEEFAMAVSPRSDKRVYLLHPFIVEEAEENCP